MQINLRNENKNVVRCAMIDSLILIRSLERNSRLHYNYMCVETLLSELEQILLQNSKIKFEECNSSATASSNFDVDCEEVFN